MLLIKRPISLIIRELWAFEAVGAFEVCGKFLMQVFYGEP